MSPQDMVHDRRNGLREHWRSVWNRAAGSDNMFVQIGRSSYTLLEFFLMVKDICDALEFEKRDIVLDAGGGAGWVSMAISPFVRKIAVFDFAEEMVRKAKGNTKDFGNIEVYHDDLLVMDLAGSKKYTKVIVGSVLQYFENYGQIETGLRNISRVLPKGGKAVFTHNPDMRKKKAHIASYKRLNWSKKRIQEALRAEEERLWIDIRTLTKMCHKAGFSLFGEVPIHHALWQSTHMFDCVVEK